ncbi:MAG: polysaccharide deacetylase [Rhodospirillaceae bacterium]|nr:polysaccharide deacetylase [Magnetovibrio sp.]MAY67231.1 polysaccharide deacetylase [Rhodospirillaceae bacterium]
MNKPLTIVMYHYVRPIASSPWPGIKGIETARFERQLDHIQANYNPVSLARVIAARDGGEPLPENPLVLTFDDGYKDHYQHVFPALLRRGLTGAFFPPTSVVYARDILDVNKVHFVLASQDDPHPLGEAIDAAVLDHRETHDLDTPEAYRACLAKADDFDPAEVIYVKRMLQHGLPEDLRREIADALFRQFVSNDPKDFADTLYMNRDDLAALAAAGMEIGSHGDAHPWLNTLPAEAQRNDIESSLRLIDDLGIARDGFLFCYPYGAYNDDTLKILTDLNCGAAVTSDRRVALLSDPILTLARIDAVDVPETTTTARTVR